MNENDGKQKVDPVTAQLKLKYPVVSPEYFGYRVVQEKKEVGGKMFHVDAATGKEAYAHRFDIAMPFTKNGLAAVGDNSGMFHIKTDGERAYPEVYEYVSPFDEVTGIATVRKKGGSGCYLKYDGVSFSVIPRKK